MKTADNLANLQRFNTFVAEQKSAIKTDYAQLLALDLARQQWPGCFQRNTLAALEHTYHDALSYLQQLPFDHSSVAVNKGLSELTQHALACFDGFADEFLGFVVEKHRTSCALSNFPDEHKPDAAYVNEVRRDIAALWKDFAIAVNVYFLE